jgi:hypothetical protein
MSCTDRRCVTCHVELSGRRFYRTRSGGRRCGPCQRERWRRRDRFWQGLQIALLVGVISPAVYLSLDLLTGTAVPARPASDVTPAADSAGDRLLAGDNAPGADQLGP